MAETQRQVIVVRFENRKEAQQALERLTQMLDAQHVDLQQGALLTRAADGVLEIEAVGESGVGKLVKDAASLTVFLAVGSVKIVAGTLRAGVGLVGSGIKRAAALTGAAVMLSANTTRNLTGGDKPLRKIGGGLEPGAAAVVVVVDAAYAEQAAAVLHFAQPSASGTAVDSPAPHDLPM